MTKYLAGLILGAAIIVPAQAQQPAPASNSTVLKTPVGTVTQTTTTTPTVQNQTYTYGNNSTIAPNVGTTTYQPPQRTEQPTTSVSVGVTIPLDSTKPTSTSTAPPASAADPNQR